MIEKGPMDWSGFSTEQLEEWAEIYELRAAVQIEDMTDAKLDLLYYVAEEIYAELAERYLAEG